jgi:putative CocE/NonD family hydrolase
MPVAAPLLVAFLQAAVPIDTNWVREHDVAVRMRDGVILRADVFRPQATGTFPTLVYRTPYGKDDVVREYTTVQRAIERGYAVVVQDVRGRYASDGAFDPYRQEGADGYDTIEWAAAQAWSTGAVGTFGLSYPGAVQWLAAVESPPSLRAMVPAMTFATPRQFFYSGGAWDLSWAAWTWFNIAPDLRTRSGAPGPRSSDDVRRAWRRESARVLAQRPLLDLPDFKSIAPWYYEWMSREPTDPWWGWADLTGRYGRTSAAVLNLSGWHDEAYGPHGAIANFTGLSRSRGRDPRTRLVIGPWVHGVDATATTRSGERRFGANAAIDYDDLVLDWMDRWVKGEPEDGPVGALVRVYVMGANEWRESDEWPMPGLRRDTLWFGPQRTLTTRPPAAAREGSTFVSDPDRPVSDPFDAAYGAHDFRALARRGNVLTFETAPFTGPVEVIGAMTAELHLETDARDVDIYVKVLDVAPDGTAYNLMSPGLELQRASYRDPAAGRQLLEPGRVHFLRLGDLITANRFERGHRLRVHILGAFLPHFSLNLQTGESERTSKAVQKARITIRHDAEYASRLILPVAPIAGR